MLAIHFVICDNSGFICPFCRDQLQPFLMKTVNVV